VSRRAAIAAGAALLFALFTALLFPTDAIVRAIVTRPGWPPTAIERARLRPNGIHLEGVTVRDDAGAPIVRADRIRLVPSLLDLVTGGDGSPWRADAELCGGTAAATVAPEGGATAVTLTWEDADLAVCPPLGITAGALAGRARGAARLRLAAGTAPAGEGQIEVAAAEWRAPHGFAALGALHAERATVRWRLGDDVLHLDDIALTGPEVSVSGAGEVHINEPLRDSDLSIRLALLEAPGAPPLVRLLFRSPHEPRHVTVAGTLAAPEVGAR
jgi:type II secretion system protein N